MNSTSVTNSSALEGASALTPINLMEPRFYLNRELSWLRFNERVLEEAEDELHPLLERLKFLGIFSNNLDEFFMIRVAGLKEQVNAQIYNKTVDGLSPAEQLQRITQQLRPLVDRQSRCLREVILPRLAKHNVFVRRYEDLTPDQREEVRKYFFQSIFPVLTPLAIDPSHPFPKIRGLDLNLLVELKAPFDDTDHRLAVVPIPKIVPRFFAFPVVDGRYEFISVGPVVEAHLESLFPNMTVVRAAIFRVTRNADLDISEAEADDLLKLIERELRKRRLGTIVRLEVSGRMSPDNADFLARQMGLSEDDVYTISTYLGLDSFMQLVGRADVPALKDEPFTPAPVASFVEQEDVFEAIRKGDVLLHQPYDSFQPVLQFVEAAAKDPDVVAIKMTLYRTSGNSPIIRALRDAAQDGKQVTALVELKARFDEKNNIFWAKEMEQVGVNVAYGVVGLKTHCKMCLVLRREGDAIRTYVHLSTGNYNERTANIYTDLSLFTCNPEMGLDVAEVFNLLTGYSRQDHWRKMLVAPATMRQELKRLIANCIQSHTPEQPSRIRCVMNSLTDPEMIRALYRAGMQGIHVELSVRGICCLVPGIPGVSETIRVQSVVGRFLEHARIFAFTYGGDTTILTGSADWMTRNLTRRIEVLYPITDPALKQRVVGIIDAIFRDNSMARVLHPDGTYHKLRDTHPADPFASQHYFLRQARLRQRKIDTTIQAPQG